MVKLAEYPRTATFSWSHDRVPVLATGTASGAIDADFSSNSTLEFWSLLSFDGSQPSGSIVADAKFNDLDWSQDNRIVAGALENGVVEFFDPKGLRSVAKIHKHQAAVKTLKFNAKQNNVLVSGGSQGEILVWDSTKIGSSNYSPFSSGTSISPMGEIASLAWNQSLAHVFASAGSSGYASIWDLKAKKEVLHLQYTSPTTGIKVPLSVVEWHPSNSTRIATASSLDSEPVILVWDLRNSNAPLKVLSNGHANGILSLDWCKQDESLLLSAGRDNTSILWNPEEGSVLTQFTPRGNWVFKSKFAPEAPDLFASSSFDGKIVVQTLQNLSNSLDAQADESKQLASEDEFWNKVTEHSSDEKPNTVKIQAPSWYGNRSPAAQWAFGGKLVKITNDHLGVTIESPSIAGLEKNELFDESLKSKDYVKLINKRLSQNINSTNEEDWNLLENLSMDGTTEYLKDALSLDEPENTEDESQQEAADFFTQLNDRYAPQGSFKLDYSESMKPITTSIIKGDLRSALSHSLEKELLLEAFVIAVTSKDDALIDKAKNAYFAKYSNQSSLSRTLFSVAQKNVEDIVNNVDVSQWKDAVKLINTYTEDQTRKNTLLIKLGDRLLSVGSRKDAILLYLAGQSLDSIAAIWLKEFPELETELTTKKGTLYEAHLECLTEFVERFTVLSGYANKGAVTLKNNDLISKFLEFVNVTATNGDFDLVLRFLETLPADNESVKNEKQRVLIALGRTSGAVSKTQTENVAQSRKGRYASTSATTGNIAPRLSNATIPPVQNAPMVQQPPTSSFPHVASRQPSIPSTVAPIGNPYVTATPTNIAPPYQAPTTARSSYSAAVTNPYAPPAASTATNPYAPSSSVTPASYSAPPVGPPPIAGARGFSGQTPHLHEKPIDGWNDLPSVAKEKPTRAKAVTTAPINVTNSLYGAPDSSSASTPVPRSATNSALPPPPNMRRTPKPASPIASPTPIPLKKTNSYAPTQPPAQPNAPTQPVANNPVLPAMSPKPANGYSFAPPVNPYGPTRTTSTPSGIVPPNPVVPNAPVPVPAAVPVSAAPPPARANRKSTAGRDADAANNLLSSIQSKPTPTNQIPATPAAVVPPPQQSSTPSLTSNSSNVAQSTPAQTAGITDSDRPIVDFFTAELQRVTPLIPQEYTKQLKDCDKRLKILIKHLENHDLLTQPTVNKLHKLVDMFKQGNYAAAMSIHQDLSVNHSSEAGNWLTGVKRLINIAEATASQ